MKRVLRFLLVLPCVAPAYAADEHEAPPPAAPRESRLQAYAFGWHWDGGLHYGVDVPDVVETWQAEELRWLPLLRGNVGLRFGLDAVGAWQGGEAVDLDDDIGVRRGYFYLDGNFLGLPKPLSYKLEIGSVAGRFSLRNASIAVHELPYLGTLRGGTFDAPMSLAFLTSSRATSLMEVGMVVEALAPGTLSGLGLTNHLPAARVTWALGIFSEAPDADVGDASDAPARVVGRLTWLPRRTATGLFHLGLSTSWAFAPRDIHYQSRPESFFVPLVVDTGDIEADQAVTFGLEGAWVRDRLAAGGEYMRSFVQRKDADGVQFGGFYGNVSLFLTPDTRVYDDAAAAFSSMVPTRPISWKLRQIGAWEVAARLSYVDLTDDDVRGGRALTLMSGLNWYWNRYVRMQCNVGYVHTSGGPRPGDAAVLQARFDLMI